MEDFRKIAEQVKTWIYEVGKVQRSLFRKDDLSIKFKSDATDLVTEADKRSEEILLKKIYAHFPGSSVITEESGELRTDSDFEWIIDPLDGTNNFAHGIPIYAISLALKYQGQTEIGIVYAPSLDEMYWTVRGHGAFRNKERIQVSHKEVLNECIIGTGFPYDKANHPENNIPEFVKIAPKLRGIRRLGACAYDLCLVAAGHLDGFWEFNLKQWDVAAGELIITEAGGMTRSVPNRRSISIVCGGPEVFKLLTAQLGKSEIPC